MDALMQKISIHLFIHLFIHAFFHFFGHAYFQMILLHFLKNY